MTDFSIHTPETAPEGSRETLSQVVDKYGFVPNMLAMMAAAPGLLKGYLMLAEQFENGTLSATEQQVILLATSYENRCGYCMGAHSAIAGMQQVPGDIIQALRDGTRINDSKLEALRKLTTSIVTNRGFPEQDDLQKFFSEGYTPAQLMEVMLGVGIKTLSNYTNHITDTPLDEAFSPVAWAHPDTQTAT
jgi:AhpD family alkylhydroperoxidase